ncbi:hypothetical protein CK203_099655 [Vitis vinifera]|uniref:Reverse transcriptase zinc-binding domain-containing protein n=1 Tax=Vitis vinifera TaxID=29760 RepID=A0A438F2K4_VITVI|nr:hypothetical protein CK203_099655 [Vitis vinifera]
MSMSKNAWVSKVWNPVGDGDGWTPLFARAFNDWEIDLVERLLQNIHAFRVQREEEDRVIWTASNDGAFSVKFLYSMLEPGGSSMFPSERIWRARVPPKVAFFAWEASWVKATLLGWNGGFVGKRRKRAWKMAPLCIFCTKVSRKKHVWLKLGRTKMYSLAESPLLTSPSPLPPQTPSFNYQQTMEDPQVCTRNPHGIGSRSASIPNASSIPALVSASPEPSKGDQVVEIVEDTLADQYE